MEVKAALLEAKRQLNIIEREKSMRLSVYQSKRKGLQLLKFLESQEIRKAKIRHVGLARQTALASYGIETALDITEEKVLQVPGFGANNSVPLLEWRKNVEKSFVYDPKPNEMDKEELQKIQFEIDQLGSEFRKILTSGPSALTRAAHAINAREKKVDPQIARAYAEFRRAKEDLMYLGIALPKKPFKASSPSRVAGSGTGTNTGAGRPANRVTFRASPNANSAAPQAQAGKRTRHASCPKCGQSMIKRVVRRGSRAGKTFYGCSTYPVCDGSMI
jgi:ssDNA-binding Zn-finger/Zn-ribbon topoisomerase 1